MKIFIFALLTLLSVNVSAGPYIDFGLGYIQSIPGQAEGTMTINGELVATERREANIELDSPLLMLRGGYTHSGFHIELDSFGTNANKDQSITSLRMYKRFYADFGLGNGIYGDFGIGTILQAPAESKSETEQDGPLTIRINSKATVNLDDTFLMYRAGYRWKPINLHIHKTESSWHLELERIGSLFEPNSSITTLRFYKRWEW